MSEAVDPEVRSIDFRDEDPSEFLAGYNTVLWQGKHRLHQGLLSTSIPDRNEQELLSVE